jgi:hypothetical protein
MARTNIRKLARGRVKAVLASTFTELSGVQIAADIVDADDLEAPRFEITATSQPEVTSKVTQRHTVTVTIATVTSISGQTEAQHENYAGIIEDFCVAQQDEEGDAFDLATNLSDSTFNCMEAAPLVAAEDIDSERSERITTQELELYCLAP